MKAEDGRRKEQQDGGQSDAFPSSLILHPSSLQRKVAVIGGGYAGLAAAVTLAQAGVPVTLFEAAKQLGGRARRVEHRGLALDNGFHILIGAYRETLRIVELVSPPGKRAERDFLRLPLQLSIHGHFHLKVAPWPAPLHLLAGLLTAQGVSLKERLGAIRFTHEMKRLGFVLPEDMSVSALLRRYDQGTNITRFLWNPLCIAALNTLPELASAQVFLHVIRDSLSGDRHASDLMLAQVDLSALFPDRAAAYLERRGAGIRTSVPVDAVRPSADGFAISAGAEDKVFSHVVCAVPAFRAAKLISALPGLEPTIKLVEAFEYQPIYSVYFQFPAQTRLPFPMVGLDEGYAQWVFDRGQLCGQRGLIGVVISAGGSHQELSHDELAQRVLDELRRHFGITSSPQWHRVIAEKRATFSCSVNLKRPGHVTPVKHFYLAGDYTESDYPATIEAAVRSGVQCARLILEES